MGSGTGYGTIMPFVKDNYESGEQLDHTDFNKVARFCNGLEYDRGIIERSGNFERCKIITIDVNADESALYSFKVTKTSDTTVDVASGYCQYASNAEVAKGVEPLTCTFDGDVYIKLNLATGVFDNATFSSSMPADTATLTYYRIASITFSSGVITQIVQRHLGDIYEGRV